jgi:hypothetical protein
MRAGELSFLLLIYAHVHVFSLLNRKNIPYLTTEQIPNDDPGMWELIARYSDNLSAGFPSAAEGYEDDPLNLHELVVRNPAATFFYRVRGDALRHECVRDGAILVVDRSVTPSHGKLIVAEQDGDFVVIRFQRDLPVIVCGVVVAALIRF